MTQTMYAHVNKWIIIKKEEWNYVICRKMNGTGNHHVKQNKPDREK
jgi:hypothetical protein